MAKEISELTGKTTPIGTDEIEIQETGGGTSKKINIADMLANISTPVVSSSATASNRFKTESTNTGGANTPGYEIYNETVFKGGIFHEEVTGDLTIFGPNGSTAAARVDAQNAFTFAGQVKLGTGSELTIATGAITATTSYHFVDTEGDAASDDLDTVNGAADGAFLVLSPANSARTIVLKDGTGNLRLAGDFSMDINSDFILLIGLASDWYEISRSNNG